MTNDEGKLNTVKLSRRSFLGSAAIGAAAIGGTAVVASALAPKFATATTGTHSGATAPVAAVPVVRTSSSTVRRGAPLPVPSTWSQSADVVVVGYGGAGAVSAITAFDAGAEVIILEKTPSLTTLGITKGTQPSDEISGGGGNTHISGGLCVWPTDPVGGALHLYSLSFGATPMDVCNAWGTVANQNKAWLDAMGIPCTLDSLSGEFPNVPGWSSISNYNVNGGGQVLFQFLDSFVQARGIPVLFNTARHGSNPGPDHGRDSWSSGPPEPERDSEHPGQEGRHHVHGGLRV